MSELVFEVAWDSEAEVWWMSKTPIPGLVTEALTLDALYQKLAVMVPEMLEEGIPQESSQHFGGIEKLEKIRSDIKAGGVLSIKVNAFREYVVA